MRKIVLLGDKRTYILLIALYLTISPSVWFWSFTLGTVKKILLGLIGITTLWIIVKHPKKILIFLLIGVLLFFSLTYTNSVGEYTYIIYGLIENYLFFLLGYNVLIKRNNISSLYFLILLFPTFECLLTISNLFVGVPGWFAPSQMENMSEFGTKGYEMLPLWGTGFSWGRNGWGCALSLLLPLCLGLEKQKRIATVFFIIIFLSIFICGNRNGLLASLLSLVLYYHYIYAKNKGKRTIIFALYAISFLAIILLGQSFLISSLRLDSGDISAGRFFQYALIPDMIKGMSFWGRGLNGTGHFLFRLTGDLGELHNTYFRLLIDYGWLLGFTIFVIAIYAFLLAVKFLKRGNQEMYPYSLIIISGLSLALFEPSAVFFTLGGYAIWWFALGKLVFHNSIKNG